MPIIDIEGLNIEKVVHALFKNAIKSKAAQKRKEIIPNGCSFEQGIFEIAHLQRTLKQTGNKLDSIGCVQFNMDFSTYTINTDAYDLIHQTGSNEVSTAEEVIDTLTSDLLGHCEKLALHEFKEHGLTKKMLIMRKSKGEEFVEEHSLALSSLRKRQFSIHAALIEIAGLKIYQVQGIAQGLTRNEVTQLTPNEIYALSELKELGLSMEMLIAHRDKKNEFSIFHVSVLISLIKRGSFSVKDGLGEIQGLTADQAGGLKHGLSREEVILLTSAEILALESLKKFGLTADILINRRKIEGEFTLLQGSALQRLVRSFSVKDSLIQISGLKTHQLQGISNDLTYEEVIRLNDSWQISALIGLKAMGLINIINIEKLINQNEPDAFTETHWKLFLKLHEGALSCQSIFARVKVLTKIQAEQELAMKTHGYSYAFFNKKKALESTHWFLQEPTGLPTVFSTNVSKSIEVHNKKPKFVKEIYMDQYESNSWQKSTGMDLPVTLYRLVVVFTNEDAEKAFYAATQKTMHFYAHSFGISFIENRYCLESISKELDLLLKHEDAPEAVYAIFEEKFGFHFEKNRGAQFAQGF